MTISHRIGHGAAILAPLAARGFRRQEWADRAAVAELSPQLLNDIGLSAEGELLDTSEADPPFRRVGDKS